MDGNHQSAPVYRSKGIRSPRGLLPPTFARHFSCWLVYIRLRDLADTIVWTVEQSLSEYTRSVNLLTVKACLHCIIMYVWGKRDVLTDVVTAACWQTTRPARTRVCYDSIACKYRI